jgi:hypothetical protein
MSNYDSEPVWQAVATLENQFYTKREIARFLRALGDAYDGERAANFHEVADSVDPDAVSSEYDDTTWL